MKILVTGTNGFLGRALFGQLKKTSYTLFPIVRKKINTEDIECDIGNASNLLTVLNYYQPDIIINCAAKVDFTDNSMTGQYNVNAVAPTIFSYWCVENDAYLIQVSGSIVNGNTTTLFSNSSIESATSYYGKTKLLADRAIRLSKCDHAIIRFGGIFGEGGPDHLGVNRAINQARVGKIPTIIAKGKAMRNYIHVQDAAKLLVYCLDNRIIGTHYSGNHQSISISQMIYDICSIYLNNANPKRQSGVESVDQVVKVSSNFPKTAPFKKSIAKFSMKIAILSDIHGNVFALKSVLDAIAKKNVEIIIIAGDFVGYYFWPVEVFDLLKNYEIIAISGNHDKMLKKARTERGYLDKICKKYGSGLNIALENLDDISLSWLENLPDSFEFKTQYGNILICHGSPWDNNEYIYPDISNGLLGRYSNLNFKWVIHGHTHYPMYKEKGGTILINPGSVGQSRNGKPGAYWALLDTELGKPYFFCEKYDLQKVIDESKKRHPEIPYLANILEVVG